MTMVRTLQLLLDVRFSLFFFAFSICSVVGSIKKNKLYIPHQQYPDINFLGLLIGPKGITQRDLQDTTGAKFQIHGRGAKETGTADDLDDLHVAIEGPEEGVDRLTKRMEEILYNPQEAYRLKSEQLSQLKEISNSAATARVDILSGSGTDEAYQIELLVPNNMVGLVIGKGGDQILRIQAQLNIHAQIAKESEMKPGETQRSIVLRGQRKNVNEAKRRIEEIVAAQIAKLSGSSNKDKDIVDRAYVVRLPVPNDKVGIIIGKGGATIKAIQDRTNTTVQIPHNPDDENPNVRTIIIGADAKECLDAAQVEIFMTLQQQQQSAQLAYNATATAMNVSIPDDRVGIVIGKGGATVKEIQQRLNVKIHVPHGADIGSNPPLRTLK
jgi:far upstream element-binding protein